MSEKQIKPNPNPMSRRCQGHFAAQPTVRNPSQAAVNPIMQHTDFLYMLATASAPWNKGEHQNFKLKPYVDSTHDSLQSQPRWSYNPTPADEVISDK